MSSSAPAKRSRTTQAASRAGRAGSSVGPYDVTEALAQANTHMSGVFLEDNPTIKEPKNPFDGRRMVVPGSVEWLYLQRLRSTKITPQIQKRWMEPLLWYQKDAYDGEFCHDFVCAKDLLCWARNCFDRCGDRWPKADGKLLTPTEFDEFSLVMEEWYADALPGRPLIMDDLLVFHVYCSSATLVQTKGRASCKEDFVLRALEQCGIPPKGKLEPGVHF